MGTIRAEKEYKWLEAAKAHEQKAKTETNKNVAAESFKKIGFWYSLASRQAHSPEEFKKLRKLSIEAYETAAKLFRESTATEKEGRSADCLVMADYTRSWLAPNSVQKCEIIHKCISNGQNALEAFKKITENLNYARTCNLLAQCMFDLVSITSQTEEKLEVAKKGLLYVMDAVSVLSNFDEKGELITSFSLASLLSWHIANLSDQEEERKDLTKKCLSYATDAATLANQTVNPYSCIMSLWAKALSSFYFGEKTQDSSKYTQKMFKLSSIIEDNYFKGVACYLEAYIKNWSVEEEEDIDKKKKAYNEIITSSEAAIQYYQLVCQDSDIAEAYLFYAESYLSLANEIAISIKDKKDFSEKSVRIGEEGLKFAVSSGSVDAMLSTVHALSKAYHYRSKLEPGIDKKLELLKNALGYREESLRIGEQAFSSNFWILGVAMIYEALIKVDLAKLEENQITKATYLKEAVRDMESGVSYSNKWLKTCSVPSLVTVAANYEDRFGGMLAEQYQQTCQKEDLVNANKTYSEAATKFKEVDLPSRVAESYWKIAINLDLLSENAQAAENFEKAFSWYKTAARKIDQFNDFYIDYASYMKAWSEIENAKYAHNNDKYSIAASHYQETSNLLKQSKSWNYLSSNFLAWSLLEQAEDLSRKDNCRESIIAFKKSVETFRESARILHNELGRINKVDEQNLVKRLIHASNNRVEYSNGRIAIEEAIISDKQGDHDNSSRKYESAAEIFRKIVQIDPQQTGKEAEPLFYLCQAWQKMTLAEARSSPILYEEAADLFKLANKFSTKESTSLLALGHSNFCKAMEAGAEFEMTRSTTMYEQTTKHMSSAANYYLRAGFESASDFTKATQRLFDAYVFMDTAKREKDPQREAKYYLMAEKVLQISAECFTKAGHIEKNDQVQRLLRKVRDEKEIVLSLNEIFNASSIASSTASFATIGPNEEEAVGLERFEHGDIQAKLDQKEIETNLESAISLELKIVNVGKESVRMTKIEKVVPAGFQVITKPDYCSIEGSALVMMGKKLGPLKTEIIRITLKSSEKSPVEIKPRIVCVDETGLQASYDVESAYDVFISYSQNDKKVADAICSTLESQEIRCWIAPRNVNISKPFLSEIIHALNNSQIFVLVFSNNANHSNHVIRETELAVHRGITIIPFRIENVLPIESMEYLISISQWLDATTVPIEKHLQKLVETVQALLSNNIETHD